MKIKLTAARIDENGNATGGAAGDQTGREVCTHDYYLHKQGWLVFRAYSAELAYRIAETAVALAANDCIGYDQSGRLTLYTELEKVGFRIDELKAKCECDCSSFVRAVLRCCGVETPNFNTSTEGNTLLKTGLFGLSTQMASASGEELCVGDILCTPKQGHTAIVTMGQIRTSNLSSEPGELIVRSGTWNLREKPGTDSRIVATLRGGTELQLSGRQWYHVVTPEGIEGWISEKGVEWNENK